VAQIFWAESARSALDRLILSHSLPTDTRERVKHSLLPLARFPRLGPEIAQLQDGKELRFLIGPWPWLVLVYVYDERTDRVTVVSPEDGRSAHATVTRRSR
jgi:plasmid stabilization system protein ParE